MKRFFRKTLPLVSVVLLLAGCAITSSSSLTSSATTSSSVSSSVTEVTLNEILVSRLPYKLEFTTLEGINTAGGQLDLKFNNNQTITVDMRDDMVDYSLLNMATIGTQNVRLNYTYNGVTRSTSYQVTIRDFKVAVDNIFFTNRQFILNLLIGTSRQLLVAFLPENATNQGVSYQSSNPEIVSIDQFGMMQALAVGEAVVSATSNETNQTISKTVIVEELADPLSVTYARELIARLSEILQRLDPQDYTAENYTLILDYYNQGLNEIYQAFTETDANSAYALALERVGKVNPIPKLPEFLFVSTLSELIFVSNNLIKGQTIVVNDNIEGLTTDLVINQIFNLDLGSYSLTLKSLIVKSDDSGLIKFESGSLNLTDYIIDIPNASLLHSFDLDINVSNITSINTFSSTYNIRGLLNTFVLDLLGNTRFNIQEQAKLFASTVNVESGANIEVTNDALIVIENLDDTTKQAFGFSEDKLIGNIFVSLGQSIQTAINSSKLNDIIILDSGIFYEEIVFDNITHRTLVGTTSGNQMTVIAPIRIYDPINFNNAITILPSSNNITIRKLTIDGYANSTIGSVPTFRDGIHYRGPDPSNNNTFEDLVIKNVDRRAISVFPMTTLNTTIKNNHILNVTGAVMGTWNGAVGINFMGTGIVNDNLIEEIVTGIVHNSDHGFEGAQVIFVNNIFRNFRDPVLFSDSWHFNAGLNLWPRKTETIIIENNLIESNYSRTIGMYLNAFSNTSVIRDNNLNLSGQNVIGLDVLNNKNGGYLIENNNIEVGANSTAIALSSLGTLEIPMIIQENILINLEPVQSGTNAYEFYAFFDKTTSRDVGVLLSGTNDTKRVKDSRRDTFGLLQKNTISGFLEGFVNLANSNGNVVVESDNIFINVIDNVVVK
jgi:hypothetical protein